MGDGNDDIMFIGQYFSCVFIDYRQKKKSLRISLVTSFSVPSGFMRAFLYLVERNTRFVGTYQSYRNYCSSIYNLITFLFTPHAEKPFGMDT